VSVNELDAEAAAALEREVAAEAIKGSAVFTFRGDSLSKTNPDGVLKYIAR